MDRRTTLVTAGVTALVAMTATAAVAVNTGLLSLPDEDVAGTLELPTATASPDPTAEPVEIETVYVDVYDQPGDTTEEIVVVPAEPTGTAVAEDASGAHSGDDEEYDDAYEDDDHEDDDAYEDDDHEDDDHEEYDHEEYEGRDDDD